MTSINSFLDIFQTINTTKKHLVESLYVDEACYNEEIDGKLDKEKFEGVYPYSYLEGDDNDKSTIIFKDLIKDTDLYDGLYGEEEFDYEFDAKYANEFDNFDSSGIVAPELIEGADTKLTTDFTLNDFIYSDTAKAKGISNIPDKQSLKNIGALANVVQKIQDELGMKLHINSCYRGPILNAIIGGAKKSDHIFGAAADIKVIPFSLQNNMKLWNCVNRLADEGKIKFRQLIFEYGNRSQGPKWVHVSINHPNNAVRENQRVFVS